MSDGSILVSWDDPLLPHFKKGRTLKFGLMSTAIIIVCTVFAFSADAVFWFVIGIIALAVVSLIYHQGQIEGRVLRFYRDKIFHDGMSYPISKISRFDYGDEGQLTGKQPMLSGHGKPLLQPTLIRMWVDDTIPVVVSENAWTLDVNHQIHATLTSALDKVRNIDKQQEHEENFGVVDDDGMPDY